MTANLLDLMGDQGRMPKSEAAPETAPATSPALKTEHVELDLVLHYDNEARGEIFVSVDGNEAKAVWLTKSQIQFTRSGKTVAATTTQGKPLADGLPDRGESSGMARAGQRAALMGASARSSSPCGPPGSFTRVGARRRATKPP
jgi:hypothetical protein